MKYQHVVVRRTGGPEVLQITEDELPAPISGQALVKIIQMSFIAGTPGAPPIPGADGRAGGDRSAT